MDAQHGSQESTFHDRMPEQSTEAAGQEDVTGIRSGSAAAAQWRNLTVTQSWYKYPGWSSTGGQSPVKNRTIAGHEDEAGDRDRNDITTHAKTGNHADMSGGTSSSCSLQNAWKRL